MTDSLVPANGLSRIWSEPLTDNERAIIIRLAKREFPRVTAKWLNHLLLCYDGQRDENERLRQRVSNLRRAMGRADRQPSEAVTKALNELFAEVPAHSRIEGGGGDQ